MHALDELAEALRMTLIESARSDAGRAGALADGLEAEVRALVEREAAVLDASARDALCERVLRLATGLGPLEPLLADDAVDEVMVNGPGSVYVERLGRIERTDVRSTATAELMHAIERILAPLGRRVDEASPLCDARLPDGSRVNVVIPPLALSGPCLTIRRFRRHGFSLADLVENETLPAELAGVPRPLRARPCVDPRLRRHRLRQDHHARGALRRLPETERIVTIEDAAELKLRQPHVVRLEARPAEPRGPRRGDDPRSSCATRCACGPIASWWARCAAPRRSTCCMALNTGHEGSLTTVHANSPPDALRRVETLALMAGVGLPHAAVREQLASALQLVVHQARGADGRRRVESVAEVVRLGDAAGTRELYRSRTGAPGRAATRQRAGAASRGRAVTRGGGAGVLGRRLGLLGAAEAAGAAAARLPGLARSRWRRSVRWWHAWGARAATPLPPSAGACSRQAPARSSLVGLAAGGSARGAGAGRWRAVAGRPRCCARAGSATGAPWTPARPRWRWPWRTRSAAVTRCAAPCTRRRAAFRGPRGASWAAAG